MSTTMRAIVHYRYGPPEVLRPADIAPPIPGADDDVLVRVHTAGLGAETWHLTTGLPYPVRARTGLRRPARPVPGRDLAGVVAAVGAKVTGFTTGDDVFGVGAGSFAECTLASPRELARKPPGVDFASAAVVPVSGITALKAVRAAAVQPGRHVLVIGAGGGVGTFAVQIAKALGAEVTGLCSGAKTDVVTAIGADHVIDYTRGEPDGTIRYDAIIDTAGNRPVRRLCRLLTTRGALIIVGAEVPGTWLGGLDRLVRARAASACTRRTLTGILSTENRADIETLADMLADGTLTPVIGRTHPLDEVPDALRNLHEGRALGKTAITVADQPTARWT